LTRQQLESVGRSVVVAALVVLALPLAAHTQQDNGSNGSAGTMEAPTAADARRLPSPEGRVIGRVVDAETGRPLPGAQVTVPGTQIRRTAGVDGRFILTGVPAGERAVEVRFMGYAAKTVTGVEVPAGASVALDVTLEPSAMTLDAIVVSAAREAGSVTRALDAQRAAVGVTSAITSEQIARSPDGDAAAAIQRVSGVTVQDGKYVFVRGLGERYTTTSLNGSRVPSPEPERKTVPLDLFPTGLLASITTLKTFTPDLPGDFSGGQVDIQTREFPVRRQLNVSLSSGLNPDVTGQLLPMAPTVGGEWLGAAAGPRLIPGVVEQTRRPQPGAPTNEMVNAMRNAWSTVDRTGRPGTSFGLSLGGRDPVLGQDLGYLAALTYSAGDEARLGMVRESVEGDHYEGTLGRYSVLWGGLLNLSTLLGSHTRLSLNNSYNRSADNEASLERGFYENHGSNIQIERLRYVERAVRSSQLQAEHQLTRRYLLDWSVTHSTISRQEPDRSEFITFLDAPTPVWYNQEGAFRAYGGLTENSFEASTNLQVSLGQNGRHRVRLGGLYRATDRDAYDNGYSIWSRQWSPTDDRWTKAPEEFFDGRYATPSDSLFGISLFNAGGDYQAEDRLLAGYAMAEVELGQRVRLVGGARIEHSEVVVHYEDILGTRGTSEPTYTDVHPSLTLHLDLTDAQKIRLSASRTLARPEYREIAPICYRVGLGEEQRCGNPELVRTRIENYDARWEWYPSATEVLSVGVFAKRFTDPIETRYMGRSGTNSLWFENAESAVNYGVEFEAMKDLGFLAWALEPVSLFANATVMKSEVRTGNEGETGRPMTGQAPYVLNTGITYTSRSQATSATLLYNVVGERITNARPSGAQVSDIVEQPRPMLDLSLRFPLMGGMDGKLDFKNLLDSPYELRQSELLRAYYRTGRSLSFGVSWRQ
jgi:outer membrane receptor for ferrienterochelin and colicin